LLDPIQTQVALATINSCLIFPYQPESEALRLEEHPMFWANLLLIGIAIAIFIDMTKALVERAARKRKLKIKSSAPARLRAVYLPGIPAVKPMV
jgi:hypothetical protein